MKKLEKCAISAQDEGPANSQIIGATIIAPAVKISCDNATTPQSARFAEGAQTSAKLKRKRAPVPLPEKPAVPAVAPVQKEKSSEATAATGETPDAVTERMALTMDESTRLITLESVITRGKAIFLEVGEALREIRDTKLYKAEYKTFETYCTGKWGFARQHAYRLINVAEIAKCHPRVTTERAARELKTVDEADREIVLDYAEKLGGVNSRLIIQAAAMVAAQELGQAFDGKPAHKKTVPNNLLAVACKEKQAVEGKSKYPQNPKLPPKKEVPTSESSARSRVSLQDLKVEIEQYLNEATRGLVAGDLCEVLEAISSYVSEKMQDLIDQPA